jgi:hypothetical protein
MRLGYISHMDLTFNPSHYSHVPVYFWPWIWWQLFWLRGWVRAIDRNILFEIAPNGRVHVTFLSDDKTDLRAWMWAKQTERPKHLDYCDNAAGDLDLNYFVYAMAKALERTGHFVRWAWVRLVLRITPPIQDSS